MTTRGGTRRRFPRRSVRRGSRGATSWTTATLSESSSGANAVTFFDVLGGLTLGEKDEINKVLTIHFKMNYKSALTGTHVYGNFGLIVASDAAISVGSSAVADPITNSDASWMDHGYYDTEETETLRIERHIRVARNIATGFSLAFKLHQSSTAEGTMHWGVFMRVLLQHR